MRIHRYLVLIFFISAFQIAKFEFQSPKTNYDNKYGEVIHVSALFRHGDRTPFTTYPKDPYKMYPWPDGRGQLTKIGERQMNNVGKWYQQRYLNLVKQIRSHVNITMRSSDVDRTLMSAQCFLAGFYPTKKDQYLSQTLQWQPIPIHTTPNKMDDTIYMGKENPCPKRAYYEKKIFNRRSTKKIFDKYNKTLEHLRKYTGLNFSRSDIQKAISEIDNVHDTLFVEAKKNFTLPKWTKEVFPRPLRTILESVAFKPVQVNRKVRRLTAGPFFNAVVSNMMQRMEKNSTKIFHFYSGHDTIISYVSIALGFKNVMPPYGSSLMFELRRKHKKHYVTVFYSNSTETFPYLLSIPRCKTPCSLKDFVRVTRHLVLLDRNRECQMEKKAAEDVAVS